MFLGYAIHYQLTNGESNMKVTKNEVVYLNKEKSYTIKAFGEEVFVSKWWVDASINGDYECDYEIQDRDTLKMTEEQEDELHEFISELN